MLAVPVLETSTHLSPDASRGSRREGRRVPGRAPWESDTGGGPTRAAMDDQCGGCDPEEDFDAVVAMLSARFRNVTVQIKVEGPLTEEESPSRAEPKPRPASAEKPAAKEAGWASSVDANAAAAFEAAHAQHKDRRYYAVWKLGKDMGDEGLGVHAGVGCTAYLKVIGLAGGFGGVKWRRYATLADALRGYAEGAAHFSAPAAARFFPW